MAVIVNEQELLSKLSLDNLGLSLLRKKSELAKIFWSQKIITVKEAKAVLAVND